jgi:hypothetical protein
MSVSREAVAERLAQAHYAVDPDIELITRLESPGSVEAEAREPIKLLEVTPITTPSGIIPVFFGPQPASGIPFPCVIIEVTPEEFSAIAEDPSKLPNGWRLGKRFPRLLRAKVG